MDYETFTDEELREEHEKAMRIQRSENDAGDVQAARSVAEVRMEIWEEAQSRGIDL